MQPIAAILERVVADQFSYTRTVAAAGVGAGSGSRWLQWDAGLRKLDLRLDADDRIALLGANGEGKSTLSKLLADRLAPLSGTVRRAAKLCVGFLPSINLMNWCRANLRFNICNDYGLRNCQPNCVPVLVQLA